MNGKNEKNGICRIMMAYGVPDYYREESRYSILAASHLQMTVLMLKSRTIREIIGPALRNENFIPYDSEKYSKWKKQLEEEISSLGDEMDTAIVEHKKIKFKRNLRECLAAVKNGIARAEKSRTGLEVEI